MISVQKILIRLLVALSLLSNASLPAYAAPLPFPDMEWSWYRYKEAVDYLKVRDVIGGYPDGTFRPRETINRAELLKIIFKGKSDTTPSRRRCFTDVNPRAWYAPYVCAAKQRGIVSGYENGSFKPENPVNMAEAMKMVLNAYGRNISDAAGEAWYAPYAKELEDKDLLPSRSYIPWEPLTRERAADLLWRVIRFDEERVIPRFSPGCGKAEPTSMPSTVTVFDQERSFLLTVPRNYISHDPSPLIVAFHGRTNSNAQVRQYFRLDSNFTDSFIAYPAAISNGNGSYSWANPGDKAQQLRDIALFDAIVERLAEEYCIDMDHIRVVGHSLGAWFANSVACVRGGVVEASATVAGDSVITTCNGPTAAFMAHNPKDSTPPISAGMRTRDQRLATNQCSAKTEPGPASLNCTRYTGCAGGNEILWCPHTLDEDERGVFYPHNWPRETAKEIRAFFDGLSK